MSSEMGLFIKKERTISVDESKLGPYEKVLLKKLWAIVEKHGLDFDSVSTGLIAGPDFGYFDLARRYWLSSLCIYISGFCKAFGPGGEGFIEPWLFNVRHAIELYLKGFIMYTEWYHDVCQGQTSSWLDLSREQVPSGHTLISLYDKYVSKHGSIYQKSREEHLTLSLPGADELILSEKGVAILTEISAVDEKSFRFRYPSIKNEDNRQHELQERGWQWNEDMLLPLTGLPRAAGIPFTHLNTINAIHDLMGELFKIANIHDSVLTYYDEIESCQPDI